MPPFAPQPLAPDARKRAWEVGPPAFARLVAETPYLTDLQRDFYSAYFAARAAKLFGVSS